MNIFDFISCILYTKKRNTLNNIDTENVFSPYMTNRWLSMYNNTVALKCNLLNKYIMLPKQTVFSLFYFVMNKVPVKKIQYFKKLKATDESVDDNHTLYSKALEVSKREIASYTQMLNSIKQA